MHVRLAFVAGPCCSWPHCSIAGACQQFEWVKGRREEGAKLYWGHPQNVSINLAKFRKMFFAFLACPTQTLASNFVTILAVLKLKLTKPAGAD